VSGAVSDTERESFAGDSRDSRSIQRGGVRKSAHVQKKILPRFRLCATGLVSAFARAKSSCGPRVRFCDKIVTTKKPLFHRRFCDRLFV
jgi:hypothetical protein